MKTFDTDTNTSRGKKKVVNMATIFRLIFLLVLIIPGLTIKGQAEDILRFEHFNTSRGLSQNTVSSILCDSKGFLWVGTNNGLNRYDGNKFRVFMNEENGVRNFTHNRVVRIWEDHLGFIWFETHDGYYHYFDPVRECFSSLAGYFTDSEAFHAVFSDFIQYSDREIWIGTTNRGVLRLVFDAATHNYTVKQYTSSGPNAISNNMVSFIHKDKNVNIWVGTDKGLTLATFTKAHKPVFKHLFQKNSFTSVLETATGLWFGTKHSGILTFRKQSQLYAYINSHTNATLRSDHIAKLLITLTGKIFAAFEDGGLQYYDQRSMVWRDVPLHGQNVVNWYEDRYNVLWVTTEKFGVTAVQIDNGDTAYYRFFDPAENTVPDEERHVFFEDSKNNLWIGTHEGALNLFDRGNHAFIHYRNDPKDANSLSANIVLSIAEDHSGQLWVGTGQFQGGLERVILKEPAFQQIIPFKSQRHISDNMVRALYQDQQGRLWMGTKAGRLHVFKDGQLLHTFDKFVTQREVLTGVNVYAISIDQKGYLWLGSKGRGLLISRYPVNKYAGLSAITFVNYEPVDSDSTTVGHLNIYSLAEDSLGNMWVGTYGNGLSEGVRDADGQLTFRRFNAANTNLSGNLVRYLMFDSKNRLWVATGYGLNLMEALPRKDEQPVFKSFFAGKDTFSLSMNDVIHVYEDHRGYIWLATFGGGINQLVETNGDKTTFRRYLQTDGLSNNVVYAIVEDDDGNMWFSTENGLSRLNSNNQTFEVFNTNNGLNFNTFSENTAITTPDGKLLFGGFMGVEMVDPAKIKIEPYRKGVELTDFHLFNKKVPIGNQSPLSKSISFTDEITLRYNQNSFSFEYSAMDYMDTEKTQYAYRLENFDADWFYVNNQRKASYTNLAPGHYVFRVKATNRNGEWTSEVRSVTIDILPPWYKTTLAYIAYSVLVILFFYIIFSTIYKVNQYRNDLKIERRVNEEKLRFFTNISHEIRTPLTLIIGPIDDLLRKSQLDNSDKPKLEIIGRNGKRMLQLTNQLLDFRKIQNNKMVLQVCEFDIVKFTRNIYESFIPLANHKNIDYRFNTSNDALYVWADPSKLDTIIYNLISNALKFTDANKQVTVTIVSNADAGIEVVVKDQGRGIARESLPQLFERFTILSGEELAGTGIGLSLAYELARLHHGDILVESEVEKGSTFILKLKNGNDHFIDDAKVTRRDEMIVPTHAGEVADEPLVAEEAPVQGDLPELNGVPLVLVVEDNHEIGDYICRSLSPEFNCCQAGNGEEAIDVLKNKNPDLIISDIMMPVMDGMVMTQHIRNDFSTSHIPIVLLTSKSSVEDQIAGVEQGADLYITKPFNAGFLKASVKNLLEQRRNLINKFRDNKTIDPATLKVNSKDEEFLQKLIEYVENNYSEEFSIETLADKMCVSRTVFYNKVKGLTGHSPVEFVRQLKLKIAAHLLAQGYNVSEAAFRVGFTDARYFSRQFKALYGYLPSKHAQNCQK